MEYTIYYMYLNTETMNLKFTDANKPSILSGKQTNSS